MHFDYIAINSQGREERGTLEARDAMEAHGILMKAHLYPKFLKAKSTSLKDIIAMKLLKSFLTTNTGWIIRKSGELIAIGVGSASAYAMQHNVPDNVVNSGGLFLTAVGGWLVSLVISKVADNANKELPPSK